LSPLSSGLQITREIYQENPLASSKKDIPEWLLKYALNMVSLEFDVGWGGVRSEENDSRGEFKGNWAENMKE